VSELSTYTITITADETEEPCRADVFVCERCSLFPRSQLAKRNAQISINGKPAKPSKKVHPGDAVTLKYTDLPPTDLEPEELPLSILYEDEQVVVIHKDSGQVVHPGAGHHSGTVIQGILHREKEMRKRFPDQPLRPGIVHRLDMDTSGTMIIAKDEKTHEFLSRQFHDRTAEKIYIALLRGIPSPREGTVTGNIGRHRYHRKRFSVTDEGRGKPAVTRYQVLNDDNGYSLVRLFPLTGRTHQLRVHMKHIGTPIAGDRIYGRARKEEGHVQLLLHAFSLTVTLPDGRRTTFRSPLPGRFKEFIHAVRGSAPGGYQG